MTKRERTDGKKTRQTAERKGKLKTKTSFFLFFGCSGANRTATKQQQQQNNSRTITTKQQ